MPKNWRGVEGKIYRLTENAQYIIISLVRFKYFLPAVNFKSSQIQPFEFCEIRLFYVLHDI